MESGKKIRLNEMKTIEYIQQIQQVLDKSDHYEAVKTVTKDHMGVKIINAHETLFGFWVPGMGRGYIHQFASSLYLEILKPKVRKVEEALNTQEVTMDIVHLPLMVVEDYLIGVVEGLTRGNKEQLGDLYWLVVDMDDRKKYIRDPLSCSVPFGIYGPSEVFDMETMFHNRKDMDYFHQNHLAIYPDGSYQANHIGSCLEIHTQTATEEGTLEMLAKRFQTIGEKIQRSIDQDSEDLYDQLSNKDLNYIGFDTIELMPEVPTSEREHIKAETGEFFTIVNKNTERMTVRLKKPNISNWGYDTPIYGSVAVSPSLLGTLRPNELLGLIETLHNMPGRPIQICIDSVLGHCDFQGAFLLESFDEVPQDTLNPKYIHSSFLTGPNMYGRDIDFSSPNVKAMLLEMLRRKVDYGFDCIRIDGAQDFIKARDNRTGFRIQDDAFLKELVSIEQNINGLIRHPDINLEDGRPWPDDLNWLYNSKYLDHTIEMNLPHDVIPKQWSPIIFAHNVHGKYKWFMDKWDRFVEVFRYGEHWITGQSNHDNARYFYKMVSSQSSLEYKPGDAFSNYYNQYLGDTKKQVVHHAMDHEALSALMLGFLPGHPMFLLNALVHTPWMFLRDIDATYSVEILASEGAKFFEWYVDEATFMRKDNFTLLKRQGLDDYNLLIKVLQYLYDLQSKVKTDALTARVLFEDPGEEGCYEDVEAIKSQLSRLVQPETKEDKTYVDLLVKQMQKDAHDSEQRRINARQLFEKNLSFLKRALLDVTKDTEDNNHIGNEKRIRSLNQQLDKLAYLSGLNEMQLMMLLEHSRKQNAYDVQAWSTDSKLVELMPKKARFYTDSGSIDLRKMASVFMKDAILACKVHRYEDRINPAHTRFNFNLRQFRIRHPWLMYNSVNHVRKDYFARKLYINGAKETGEWGDKGDTVLCNTIYYGWRTSPDETTQIFFIANMEGATIDLCPLNIFLNFEGEWKVGLHSPTLALEKKAMNKEDQIKDFKNGEALILERKLIV
ncbi:glucosylglycerol hydrolase [Petrocella sp. FN5]|uniref:glucosylglycerol hydrolase n=1 Tax=Petrocella sp. FN5 TaxID=3032002 RepID=UPI0023DA9B03|nr:glucosylglycerol hydrolase [Petrocella sp. FN5]MDF1616428.1 glucosylglycerol hydrolase [Petrocella sp. FN5]